MIAEIDARRQLLQAGFQIDLQCPYRELTVLNAKYKDVREFLNGIGYDGKIAVIGKLKESKGKIATLEGEVDKYTTHAPTNANSTVTHESFAISQGFYEQLSFEF